MIGIPIELIHLFILLITIVFLFVILKRPIYEAMFFGFVVMTFLLGKQADFFSILIKPATNTLFYAIVGFMSLAFIFSKLRVVEDIITFILAIFGRFKGGAGYVSLFVSTFMAALSGTGPGNVASTGVFTIPAMIDTNFPRELAATVEMSASSLGPMIPPSGTILLAFGVLDNLYPGSYTISQFWITSWIIGIFFVLQRALTLYFLCIKYDVSPVAPEDIPSIKEAFTKGWKTLLIPLIIFIPLILDFLFKDSFFTSRLGQEGAKALSSSIILFTPGLAASYAIFISRDKFQNGFNLNELFQIFKKGILQVTPIAATIYFAYCISILFQSVNFGHSVGILVESLNMSSYQLIIFFPLFTCFLGMILPGSSQIAIFGGSIITSLVGAGVNPLLAAAILPAITGALEGMTPPLALAMYTAMGIAGSEIKETSRLALVWVFFHLLVAFLILFGVLPIGFIGG